MIRFSKSLVSILLIVSIVVCGVSAALAAKTLTMADTYGTYGEAGFKKIIERFEAKYPEYKVEREFYPGDVGIQRILTAAVTGTLPDVVRTDAQYRSWIDKGVLKPLDMDIMGDTVAANAPGFNDLFKDMWGTQYAVGNFGGNYTIFYRTDIAEEAGFAEFPTSWEGLIDWGQKTVKFDASGKMVREGYRLGLKWYPWPRDQFAYFLMTQGGQLLNEAETEATFDTLQGLKAIQFMHDMIWKYKVTLPLSKQAEPGIHERSLIPGYAAAAWGMSGWAGALIEAAKEDPSWKTKWNTARFWPKPPGGVDVTLVAGDGWAVTRTGDPMAWKLLLELTSYQGQIDLFMAAGHFVSRLDVMTSPEVMDYLKEWAPGATNVLSFWADPEIVKASVGVMTNSQNIEIGWELMFDPIIAALEDPDADLSALLEDMAKEVNKVIGR